MSKTGGPASATGDGRPAEAQLIVEVTTLNIVCWAHSETALVGVSEALDLSASDAPDLLEDRLSKCSDAGPTEPRSCAVGERFGICNRDPDTPACCAPCVADDDCDAGGCTLPEGTIPLIDGDINDPDTRIGPFVGVCAQECFGEAEADDEPESEADGGPADGGPA